MTHQAPDIAATVATRIAECSDRLTQSEARLVAELMRVPRDIALATAAEFARRCDVHEATTSRLARKLGYAGYTAFRNAMREEYLKRSEPADRLSQTLSMSGGAHFRHLISGEIAALQGALDHVDDGAIARAVEDMAGRRVFLFAQGHATTLADMADRRLRRIGIDSRVLQGPSRDLAEQALALAKGDVLLAFAFRRAPRHYAPLMQIAAEAGAATIAISDLPTLRPMPSRLLSAPRGGPNEGFQTLTVPMAITNALILALGARQGGSTMAPLERLGRLIDIMENQSAR